MSDTSPSMPTAPPPAKITGQAPRITIDGDNGTNLLLRINETARATETILKKLDESVLPQLSSLWTDLRTERKLAAQDRAAVHQRVERVEKRQDALDSRRLGTASVFLVLVLALALGGVIARTYDALVLPHLGASHARSDRHAPEVPELER